MKKIYIVAIIAAVLAGVSLFNFLLTVKKESKVNFDSIVIANAEIPAHTALTADMLIIKQVPKEGIHPLSAKNIKDVVGLVTTERLLKDEQIMIPNLQKTGESTGGLSYTIPDNMRAITVAVDEFSGVSGFIAPGDKVDILSVITIDNGGSPLQASIMTLQNIVVLAVGNSLNKPDADAPTYKSITLLTTPDDAVKLNLVTTTGAMRIILRGPTDTQISNIVPKTPNNVSN